jgi:DNA-binding XRE family transcriptional regulator
MNLSLKLMLFREYKNWQPGDVASGLGISIETYVRLESGKAKINGIIAQKLSDLYKAPVELFIIDDTPHYMQAEVVYTNCSFRGGGSNGYINHQNNDRGIDEILYAKNEEIKDLKQQIEQLRQQNDKLISLLGQGNKKTFLS